jgi:plasmid stability protein
VRWIGRVAALALTLWIAAVAAGAMGFATLPPLPAHLAVRLALPSQTRVALRDVAASHHRSVDVEARRLVARASRAPHTRAAVLRLQQRTARASAGRI